MNISSRLQDMTPVEYDTCGRVGRPVMFLERLARALQQPVTMWPRTVWLLEREKRSVTGNLVQKSVTGKTSSWGRQVVTVRKS